jgi:archaellum component FlaC
MSKEQKNVFEKITDALTTATDELQTTNNYLFGIGAELADIAESLKTLSTQLADFMSKPLQVTVDTQSLAQTLQKQSESTKPLAAEKPKVAYPSVR